MLINRRESIVAQLTKDRDALIRAKKDIKLKFEAVDTYLNDYTRASSAPSTTWTGPGIFN